jgi:hypothetical protein
VEITRRGPKKQIGRSSPQGPFKSKQYWNAAFSGKPQGKFHWRARGNHPPWSEKANRNAVLILRTSLFGTFWAMPKSTNP